MKTYSLTFVTTIFVLGLLLGGLLVSIVALFNIVPSTPTNTRVQTSPIYTNASSEMIVVLSPERDAAITSPLTVKGRARGTWYFEASAPMELLDGKGEKIAEGFVTAQDNWMTEEFVSFEGVLTFNAPGSGQGGTLILRADNPSGLPKYDRSVEIQVEF